VAELLPHVVHRLVRPVRHRRHLLHDRLRERMDGRLQLRLQGSQRTHRALQRGKDVGGDRHHDPVGSGNHLRTGVRSARRARHPVGPQDAQAQDRQEALTPRGGASCDASKPSASPSFF